MQPISFDKKVFIKAGSVGFPQEEVLGEEVLHDGTRKKKKAQLVVVHHNSGVVRYKLTLKEYEVSKDGNRIETAHLLLDEDSTDKLFQQLLSRESFAEMAQTTFYTLVESIAPLDKTTIEQLVKFLRRAARNNQLENILPSDIVTNFSAVVNQILYKRAIDELRSLLTDDHSEKEYGDWFLKNPWVFGTEYLATNDVKIGWRTRGDIILRSIDGYHDIIELKLPSEDILVYDKSHDNWYPSAALSKAISQAIKYIQESEDSRVLIESKEGVPFLKPRAKIVIGRSNEWLDVASDKRMDCLRKLNAQLHNVQVMTYDHLLLAAEAMVSYYSDKSSHYKGGEV